MLFRQPAAHAHRNVAIVDGSLFHPSATYDEMLTTKRTNKNHRTVPAVVLNDEQQQQHGEKVFPLTEQPDRERRSLKRRKNSKEQTGAGTEENVAEKYDVLVDTVAR